MAWDTASTPIFNRRFYKFRNRLLSFYLLAITTILGVFSVSLYFLIAHDRNQQLNNHLRQVANSSASALELIKHEYEELSTEKKYKGYVPVGIDGKPVPITITQLMGKYRAASVSQIPEGSAASFHQGVEWYNAERHLMVREGKLFLEGSLPLNIPQNGIFIQVNYIRSFIRPVYKISPKGNYQIIGYIRVTESTFSLEAELRRLQWSLIIGAFTVLGLVIVGGIWLIHESLQPMVYSFEQLKQFTADASHELRNPMTAIRASIAVLKSHPERIHPADMEKLAFMESASVQMSRLIDDLLLLARMDYQAPDQEGWVSIELDELLTDLLEIYSDQAQQLKISVKFSFTPNITIHGDASQLQRLFMNLLTNALQYTPAGGTVSVTLQRQNHYALVAVEDTGIGIAPTDLPHIFKRFWRAEEARCQYQQGSGLGLAIAKTIAQRHQGDITVQSKLGKGSCFCVKLPLAR